MMPGHVIGWKAGITGHASTSTSLRAKALIGLAAACNKSDLDRLRSLTALAPAQLAVTAASRARHEGEPCG